MNSTGVDACNTVLEVLLFAAATNLGQGWNVVLTLFGGTSFAPRIASARADRLRQRLLPFTSRLGTSTTPRR